MALRELHYKHGTIVSIFYSPYPFSNIYAQIGDKCVYSLRQLKRALKKIGLNSGSAVKIWNDSFSEAYRPDYGFYDAR
jgi:hypothetical protein